MLPPTTSQKRGPPPGGNLSGEQGQPPNPYPQQNHLNRADGEQESNTR